MDARRPHALVIPFPAQGHVIPILELSYSLIDHGFRITFVNTESIHDRVVAAMPKMNVVGEDGRIRLVKITDGMAPGEDRSDLAKLFRGLLEVMPGALEELIGSIIESDNDGKITCIIVDSSIGWAVSVARKMGIPSVAFCPASATTFATIFQITKMNEDGTLGVNGTVAKHGMIRLSPTMPEIDPAHLIWLCLHDTDAQQKAFLCMNHANQELKHTDWILCNSCYELEQSACDLVGRILPIGPLIAGRRHGRLQGNFWQEDSTCISWLDQQPDHSVIYVAFGSTTFFHQHQFQELAIGLEISGKRFLWVVRPGRGTDRASDEAEEGYYPDAFTDRVADRGRIVAWSPQQKVLAHPAIACFFTHCGWNSTMEGLSNGVPFLCWPHHSDQFLNKAYITDVWKVGLEVKPGSDGIISREEINRKVEALVGNKEIRARSLELKALARKNASEGGSSWKNLNNFIEAMKSKLLTRESLPN